MLGRVLFKINPMIILRKLDACLGICKCTFWATPNVPFPRARRHAFQPVYHVAFIGAMLSVAVQSVLGIGFVALSFQSRPVQWVLVHWMLLIILLHVITFFIISFLDSAPKEVRKKVNERFLYRN